MKNPISGRRIRRRFQHGHRGFALVVSLSLMVLLTVLAVGLLTLSGISLRSTSRGEAQAAAQANARMALMIALGELQKHAGPDTRITAPANLRDETQPAGLTGVWRSWKPDMTSVSASDYTTQKSDDNFLGYLVSNPDPAATPDSGTPPTSDEMATLVGEGSLGENLKDRETRAPIVHLASASLDKPNGGYAWIAMDENVKARLDLDPPPQASSLGEQITGIGAPARNRFPEMSGLEFLETQGDDTIRETLSKLVSFKQAELPSASRPELARYFHDFSVHSMSLQTNVASGGLKTDLSVIFEGNYRQPLPGEFNSRYLYSNDTIPFPAASSNADIRWPLLANYARLYQVSSASDGNPLTGLRAQLPSGYQRKMITDTTAAPPAIRTEPSMGHIREPILMPTVVRVDTIFSLVARPAHQGRATQQYPYMLHLMYLPVITLHNPYNTQLRCNNFKVEFADIPVGFKIWVNGQAATTSANLVPMNSLYNNENLNNKKTFSVTLSNALDSDQEIVMGPGETVIFGTPFSKDATWASEVAANGSVMFDWANNKTTNVRMTPGMITGPNDGIGFDVDWLAPDNHQRAPWLNARLNEGVILLKSDDRIQVEFGPRVPQVAMNMSAFTVTTRMGAGLGIEIGRTQVLYQNQAKLNTLLSEGVSPRYPEPRQFPVMFPAGNAAPLTTADLLEANATPFKSYVRARPFAVFSIGAKTTVESFTKSRPVADTGIAFQMATADFRNSGSQGGSPLEIAFVPIQNGSGTIESDGNKAFFFGGHGSTNGTTAATIYEVPLAPLQSIAQLRHANSASLGAPPYVTYSIGESRAHPLLPSNATHLQQGGPQAATIRFLSDHSWLSNTALWDDYWFSSLSSLRGPAYSGLTSMDQPELARQFFSGERQLPNTRNTPYLRESAGTTAEKAILKDGRNTAASILTEGGFNVNSTSVAAWTAVLSSLTGAQIPLGTGTLENGEGTTFPRYRRPAYGNANANATAREKLWNAYRSLSADEVRTLAENIVEEVRERGPFLSLGEFVNRRIGAPGELSRAGALQMALDKSGVNSPMDSNARTVDPQEAASYGLENPDAVRGSTAAGAPGSISQGDVLSSIGSFITVRSDTFTIRAYGDARDAGGKIIARAWCEATVQRFPDYVDSTDTPEVMPSSAENINFGRRFQIISFRWLTPREI